MKKRIISALLILVFLLITPDIFAQGPPEPPENPGDGGGPVGGGAPIGAGLGIMLALGAAYGGVKVYTFFKSVKEELEA